MTNINAPVVEVIREEPEFPELGKEPCIIYFIYLFVYFLSIIYFLKKAQLIVLNAIIISTLEFLFDIFSFFWM